MNYRAVGNRCAVHLPSLNLNLPPSYDENALLQILQELGFSVVDVDLAALARTFVGVSEYRLKVTMEEAPKVFNCSSFTKYLYAMKGIWIPRLAVQQRQAGSLADKPSPGDLVFTTGYRTLFDTDPRDNIGHVGTATGRGTVIHAANSRERVIESTYDDFYSGEPRGIRRIILPGTITLEQTNPNHLIETSDDFRWLILKNVY
jgi:NlpC/P60 family